VAIRAYALEDLEFDRILQVEEPVYEPRGLLEELSPRCFITSFCIDSGDNLTRNPFMSRRLILDFAHAAIHRLVSVYVLINQLVGDDCVSSLFGFEAVGA
jgi:hypothetical protein